MEIFRALELGPHVIAMYIYGANGSVTYIAVDVQTKTVVKEAVIVEGAK